MDDFVSVAKTSDLSDGEIMLVEVGDERIALSKIDGSFYAIAEVSPHAEGPLSDGTVDDEEVECPWHGSRFNLKTGEVTSPPAGQGVARYAVRLEGDDVWWARHERPTRIDSGRLEVAHVCLSSR